MPAALEVSDEPPLHAAEVSRSSIAYLATAARLTSAVLVVGFASSATTSPSTSHKPGNLGHHRCPSRAGEEANPDAGEISGPRNSRDQTSYRLVIDAGHNEGTSLREDAGYDEKC